MNAFKYIFDTPLLDEDEMECGPWPSFVNVAPPEDHDQGETGDGDTGE